MFFQFLNPANASSQPKAGAEGEIELKFDCPSADGRGRRQWVASEVGDD